MGYYVNKNQFMDEEFLKTLEYLRSTGVSISPEISAVYNINAEVASGNYSNLRQIERELEASEDHIERHQENIHNANHDVFEAIRAIRKAKKDWWQADLFSNDAKRSREELKRAKERKAHAKKRLDEMKKSYQKYLARLSESQGEKKSIEDDIADCKAKNEELVADVQSQIDLVTEFKARMEALKKTLDFNKAGSFDQFKATKIKIGNDTRPAGEVYLELQACQKSFTISTSQPLTADAHPFQLLQSLEQQAISQDKQQDYQDRIPQEKEALEEARVAYIDGNKKYLNKQSRGEGHNNDDDGR